MKYLVVRYGVLCVFVFVCVHSMCLCVVSVECCVMMYGLRVFTVFECVFMRALLCDCVWLVFRCVFVCAFVFCV